MKNRWGNIPKRKYPESTCTTCRRVLSACRCDEISQRETHPGRLPTMDEQENPLNGVRTGAQNWRVYGNRT